VHAAGLQLETDDRSTSISLIGIMRRGAAARSAAPARPASATYDYFAAGSSWAARSSLRPFVGVVDLAPVLRLLALEALLLAILFVRHGGGVRGPIYP
jgi:hypothetical protein